MVQLWENWSLFHPSEWVPRLFALLGMPVGAGSWDACWSYEFEDKRTNKLTDITLHARDESGHEILLAIEAKWGKDSLKSKPKVGLPDANPNAYTNLDSYKSVLDRRMVYLVHESKREKTQTEVRANASDGTNQWAICSWEDLISLQAALAEDILPESASKIVATSVLAQGNSPCIDWDRIDENGFGRHAAISAPEQIAEVIDPELVEVGHLRHYLLGAKLFWECKSGATPSVLPFEYLGSELSFAELHDQIATRRKHRQKNSAMEETTVPLWRLGPA